MLEVGHFGNYELQISFCSIFFVLFVFVLFGIAQNAIAQLEQNLSNNVLSALGASFY